MEFEQVLRLRQTVRSYTAQRISDVDLGKILKAAQMAPLAAGDDKTTHLTVVNSSELMEEIRNICMLSSRKTGKKMDAFYGAQTAVFASATETMEDKIKRLLREEVRQAMENE